MGISFLTADQRDEKNSTSECVPTNVPSFKWVNSIDVLFPWGWFGAGGEQSTIVHCFSGVDLLFPYLSKTFWHATREEEERKPKVNALLLGICAEITHVDVIPRSSKQIDKINKHPNKRLYVFTYLHAKLSKLQVMPFPINVSLQLSEKVCWTLLLIILPCTIMHLLCLCWQLTKEWHVQWCHMESHFLKALLWPYPLLAWKWMRHFTKR